MLLTIKQGLSKIQKQIKKIMQLMPPVTPPSSRPNTLEKKQVRHNTHHLAHTGSCLGYTGSCLACTGSCLAYTGSCTVHTGSLISYTGSYMADTGSSCLTRLGSWPAFELRSHLTNLRSYLAVRSRCINRKRKCRKCNFQSHHEGDASNSDSCDGSYLDGSSGCVAQPSSYLTEPGSGLARSRSYLTEPGSRLARSRSYLSRSVSSFLGLPADLLEVVEEAYLLQDMS